MKKEEEHFDISSNNIFQQYLTVPKSALLQFWLIIASLAHKSDGVELIPLPFHRAYSVLHCIPVNHLLQLC